jgi:hypothetical protein
MVTTFPEMIQRLESFGVLDVLLPFMLIFVISYAVLQKSNIMGDNKRPYNKVVAFVLAMSVVIPHVMNLYPAGRDVVDIINNALPRVSLVMVAGMMVLLVIGVFGKDVSFMGTDMAGLVVVFSIISVAYIFLTSSGMLGLPPWLNFLEDEETQSLVITLLVFGIIIWFITKEPKEKGTEREPVYKTINHMFGDVLGKK